MSDAITNAGRGPVPHEIAEEQHMRSKRLPQWCYRIDRKDHAKLTMLTWGSQVKRDGQTVQDLATYAAGVQRVTLPSMGDLTLVVWVWTAGDDEHYRKPVPAEAVPFEFAPHTPEPPETAPCPQGNACRLDPDLDYCGRCDH